MVLWKMKKIEDSYHKIYEVVDECGKFKSLYLCEVDQYFITPIMLYKTKINI